MTSALSKPVAIIGAGSSGLAAARAFLDQGFDVEILEREDDIGGNWNYGKPNARVYESTHTVSSKPFTQYPDFPMPDEFPDYPHHTEILQYLRRYCEHFDLAQYIQFQTEVVDVSRPDDADGWRVTTRDRVSDQTTTGHYRAVVVANGHNWSPKVPEFPGRFDGEIIHSSKYREPSVLKGKNVCVVGAGNTGCDVVVKAAEHADRALHSTRRGYWYAPKFVFGKPGDQIYDMLLTLRLPPRAIQSLMETTVRLTVGHPTKAGLPRPDHRFLETHPVTNELLIHYAKHGRIEARGNIAEFDGGQVVFEDGRRDAVDLVVLCTGYHIALPFLDRNYFDVQYDRPQTYLNIFAPDADDLFFIGFIQPDSGQFKLVHWQSVAAARYLRSQTNAPGAAAQFEDLRNDHIGDRADGGIDYKGSSRHFLEIQHMDYLRELAEAIETLGNHRR